MARTYDYNSSGKTYSASATATLTFTSSDIPSNGVVAYHFAFQDAGSAQTGISVVTRLRVKVNGVAIYDLSFAFLRAYLFRFSRGGYAMPAGAITTNAAVATPLSRFTIPFYILDAPTKDNADVCQFPPNSNVTVEVTITTGANQSGSLICGWTQTNVPAACYPKLLGSQMAIGAGSASGRFNLSDEGIVEGIGLNTIGLGRAKLVLGGAQVLNLGGQEPNFPGGTPGEGSANAYDANSTSLLWESQQLDTDWSTASAGTLVQDATPNNPSFFDIHSGLTAPPGSSYVELTTLATNWAGVANECTVYSVVPLGGGR